MPSNGPKSPAKPAQDGAGNGTKPRRRDLEVLNVAAQIFYERGYASATVQDVADALGMLKGSLYYYIDSKEDLLYRLIAVIHDEVDALLALLSAEEQLSPIERLELYARRVVEYNAKNLTRISVYYHDIDQLTDPRRKELLSRRRVHERYVADLIREAQADGDVASDLDPKLLSNCVFGTIIWMYRWYKPGGEFSVEELSDTATRFVRSGLSVPPTRAGQP
ncbi:MAG TPA: TetR/AcrR family transcriptional regulator [Solirubrobacteraceae bacterium]